MPLNKQGRRRGTCLSNTHHTAAGGSTDNFSHAAATTSLGTVACSSATPPQDIPGSTPLESTPLASSSHSSSVPQPPQPLISATTISCLPTIDLCTDLPTQQLSRLLLSSFCVVASRGQPVCASSLQSLTLLDCELGFITEGTDPASVSDALASQLNRSLVLNPPDASCSGAETNATPCITQQQEAASTDHNEQIDQAPSTHSGEQSHADAQCCPTSTCETQTQISQSCQPPTCTPLSPDQLLACLTELRSLYLSQVCVYVCVCVYVYVCMCWQGSLSSTLFI